jgi:hypothetical protein
LVDWDAGLVKSYFQFETSDLGAAWEDADGVHLVYRIRPA